MKNRKVLIISLVVVGFIALSCASCPKKLAHEEAVSDKFSSFLLKNDDLNDESIFMSGFASLLVPKLVDTFLSASLSVDNYWIFSVGRISYAGETKTVSVGFLGNVIVLFDDKDQNLSEMLRE